MPPLLNISCFHAPTPALWDTMSETLRERNKPGWIEAKVELSRVRKCESSSIDEKRTVMGLLWISNGRAFRFADSQGSGAVLERTLTDGLLRRNMNR